MRLIQADELKLAGRMAMVANHAYSPHRFDDRFRWDEFGQGACQGVVARVDDTVILAFTGTNQKTDWLSNAQSGVVVGAAGANVHQGFWEALKPALTTIHRLVARAQYRDGMIVASKFYITGHSLGGALATLYAMHVENAGILPAVNGVYTFGSPRVMPVMSSLSYEKMLGSRTFRYVNESDIVSRMPHLAVKWWGLLPVGIAIYKHVGQLSWYDGSQWRGDMPVHERLQVWWSKRGVALGDAVGDHSMDRYVEKLPSDAEG